MVGGVDRASDGQPARSRRCCSRPNTEPARSPGINIEAYEGPDSVPVRVAGDRLASSSGSDELVLEVNVLAVRMDGRAGFGTLDVMRPA